MAQMDGYYICDYETHVPILGPILSAQKAATVVNAAKWPRRFCVMSRYQLAEGNLFPRTKQGDRKILALVAIALDRAYEAIDEKVE